MSSRSLSRHSSTTLLLISNFRSFVRSTQVLLILASPSNQVAQSRSCSPFQRPIMIYLITVQLSVRKLLTLHDCVRETMSAPREFKQCPAPNTSFSLLRRIPP
ncbi:hypothetical protein BDZ45DRAFT_672760 [Acephala macrosclerotiorum]|nr:hypothetical protein BDZ45DRAFT_672760 [Acephala macrosclerotiorum]